METIKDKIKDILDANNDNDANWGDGKDPDKVIKDLTQLLTTEIDAILEGLKMVTQNGEIVGATDKEILSQASTNSFILHMKAKYFNKAVSEINERIEKMKGEK